MAKISIKSRGGGTSNGKPPEPPRPAVPPAPGRSVSTPASGNRRDDRTMQPPVQPSQNVPRPRQNEYARASSGYGIEPPVRREPVPRTPQPEHARPSEPVRASAPVRSAPRQSVPPAHPARPQAKPASLTQTPASNRQAPAAQPKQAEEAKPKRGSKKLIIAACGLLLVVLSRTVSFTVNPPPGPRGAGNASMAEVPTERRGRNAPADPMMDPNSTAWGADQKTTLWSNPEVSSMEKRFCRGNQSANFCSEAPLHPFVPVFDAIGKKLKFPSTEDNKMIEQWYELKNRPLSSSQDLQ